MNKCFVVLETAGCEVLSLRLFAGPTGAAQCFEHCAAENRAREHQITREIPGTVRIAGDDSYCVQLIAQKPRWAFLPAG